MDDKDFKIAEWAEEVSRKIKNKVDSPLIMAAVCKEFLKLGDIEKAKINVANKLINED